MMTLDPVSKRRLFTLLKWNKVWLPAGSKMIQHLWYNVMMYNCTHFYLAPNFRNNGWGSLNQAQSWSPSFSLFHFFIFKVKVFPRFYASLSFMIPCSIYFFFHSTDATYSNRSTFWSNLGARSVLFSFQPLHTFSWQAWVELCKLDIT